MSSFYLPPGSSGSPGSPGLLGLGKAEKKIFSWGQA